MGLVLVMDTGASTSVPAASRRSIASRSRTAQHPAAHGDPASSPPPGAIRPKRPMSFLVFKVVRIGASTLIVIHGVKNAGIMATSERRWPSFTGGFHPVRCRTQ